MHPGPHSPPSVLRPALPQALAGRSEETAAKAKQSRSEKKARKVRGALLLGGGAGLAKHPTHPWLIHPLGGAFGGMVTRYLMK